MGADAGSEAVATCKLQGGTVTVFEDRVEIERTGSSMFDDKTIPMTDIRGVEYSSGLVTGHIQLQLVSMEPATGGFLSHPVDENTLYFGRSNRDCAAEVRDAIIQRAEGDQRGSSSYIGSLKADQAHIQNLLANPIRNAVEHGGVNVTVRLGPLDDRPGFYIEDDGDGIQAADREEVFDSGFTSKDENAGYGRNIVREIADAHGQDVTVTAGLEGGARFEFTGVDVVQ